VSNNIRLALVGAGRWGRNYIKTIKALDGVTLTHLVSRNPESGGLVDRNCNVATDWRSLIGDGEIDGLIIATPPATHTEIALEAIGAGLPVLIEKPLTLDISEARLLVEAAEEHGALVRVDHTHLYSPAFGALKNLVSEWNRVDKIYSGSGNWGPFRKDAPVLWDWGAHDFAMILDIVGKYPESISARQIGSYEVEGGRAESIAVELEWETGLTAKVELNNHRSEKLRRFAVFRDNEILVYDDVSEEKLVRSQDGGGGFEPIPVASTPPLALVVQAFVEAIYQNAADWSELKLGEQVVAILGNCDESMRENLD